MISDSIKLKELYRNTSNIHTENDIFQWVNGLSATTEDFDNYFKSKKNNQSFFSEHLSELLRINNFYFTDYMLTRYNEEFQKIKHTDRIFIKASEITGFENIFLLLYKHNILPQKTDIMGHDLLSHFFETKQHKAFECLLHAGHEPVFYQINNSLDNAISNMDIDKLIYLKSKGFDLTKNISYDKRQDEALNTIKDCYFSKKDQTKLIQLFKLYSNELTHEALNTHFNKMLFNMHYETIIALKENHNFYIIPKLKEQIMHNCAVDNSDTQSLYRKEGIEKLNLILNMGIDFKELNKNERFLERAIKDFAPLPFIKILVNKGASINNLDQSLPDGLLSTHIKRDIEKVDYLNYFMTHNVQVNNDLLFKFFTRNPDFAKNKKYTRLIENIFLANEPDYNYCEFNIYIDPEKRNKANYQRRANSITFYMGNKQASVNALTYIFYQNPVAFCNILKSLTINDKNIDDIFDTFDAIIKCGNAYRARILLSQLRKKDPLIFSSYVSKIEDKKIIDDQYLEEIKMESVCIMKEQLQKSLKSIKIQKVKPTDKKRL